MTRHVVVDGSNLATEGRSMPSLTQLNEAVLAYMAEHPDDLVTVVVDATFGHRIDKKEVAEFDAAVANNELVAPPAGAVGRGDAFVLSIANKVGAIVLSNDSFQEFHAQYEWLFEEGRLIGGKPVPHVGWVFVPRVPVRGPVSRKATRDAKKGSDAKGGDASGRTKSAAQKASRRSKASKEANQPMPVPKEPPPGGRMRTTSEAPAESSTAGEQVNELLVFLEFVEQHPVGTPVSAVVDHYSSHGAYVRLGDVKGYVPLRNMADPAPRSARSVMSVGDTVELVVASFNPRRRSIDLAVPAMTSALGIEVIDPAAAKATAAEKTAAKKAAAKKTAAKKTAAKKTAAKETAAKKTAAKKAAANTKAAAKKTAPAKKAASKPTSARKAPARKAAAKTSAAKATPATEAPAKKTATKKTATKKTATKKTATKKTATKKTAAKKTATTKAPARKAPAKKAPPPAA